MSKEDFVVNAQIREHEGKGASRRLRRQSLVPAIIYGGDKKPQSIAIESKELNKHLETEAFYSHIISMQVAGNHENVILKDLQRHPAKPTIIHADFLRVSKDQKLTTRVPLHFINENLSKAVKIQGSIITHSVSDLEISCLPADLPEYIEVDLIDLELGQIVHLSDIQLPPGVESVLSSHGEEHDLPIAAATKPKSAGVEKEDEAVDEDEEAEPGEK